MRWIWIIGVVAIAGWLIVGCGVDTGKRYGWLKDPFSYYPGITPPGGSGGGGGGVPGSNPGNYDQQEQEVFDLVNQERQNAGHWSGVTVLPTLHAATATICATVASLTMSTLKVRTRPTVVVQGTQDSSPVTPLFPIPIMASLKTSLTVTTHRSQ